MTRWAEWMQCTLMLAQDFMDGVLEDLHCLSMEFMDFSYCVSGKSRSFSYWKCSKCSFFFLKIQITWYKDEEELVNGENYDLASSQGICSLEIAVCRMSDAGRYTCRAANAKGVAETCCQLIIYGQFNHGFHAAVWKFQYTAASL